MFTDVQRFWVLIQKSRQFRNPGFIPALQGSEGHRYFKGVEGKVEPTVHRKVTNITLKSLVIIGTENCSENPVHKPTLGHRRVNWEEQLEVGVADVQVIN